MDAPDVRQHIEYKRDTERTLPADVAARMLAALDRGEPADYQLLLKRARLWMPAVVYHSAPFAARAAIEAEGLRPSLPDTSGNWPHGCAAGQPLGVYVGPEPDDRGVWAHCDSWDVWAIDVVGLAYEVDELNPDGWLLTAAVPPERLTLLAHYNALVAF